MTNERAILGPRIYKASMASENGVFVSIDMANSLLDQIDELRAALDERTRAVALLREALRELGMMPHDARGQRLIRAALADTAAPPAAMPPSDPTPLSDPDGPAISLAALAAEHRIMAAIREYGDERAAMPPEVTP